MKHWAFWTWIIIFLLVVGFGLYGHLIIKTGGFPWKFWHYWEVGALVSTLAYNLIFYIVGFWVPPRLFVNGNLKDESFIGLVGPIMGLSIGALVWATYLSFTEGSCKLQLFLVFVVVCSFLLFDWRMMCLSRNSNIAEDFHSSVKFNDWPAVAAFGVLWMFSLVYRPDGKDAGVR